MNGNQPSAATGGDEAVDPDFTQSAVTFYFVNPGTMEKVTATVTYTQADGTQSTSVPASAVFMINGPSGNLLPQAMMLTTTDANGNSNGIQVYENGELQPRFGPRGTSDPNNLAKGPIYGIVFTSNAGTPSGANSNFTWVQIITAVGRQSLTYAGSTPLSPFNPSAGLDGTYPYVDYFNSANSDSDTPFGSLASGWGERDYQFDATMYLMWDPGIGDPGCHPASATRNLGIVTQTASTCTSIPIPLGSVRWTWSGCAINTLQQQPANETTWILSCGKNQLFDPQPIGFPSWSTTVNPL
jgi:hypothetical protein